MISLTLILKCAVCEALPSLKSFPLCLDCKQALKTCPPLCPDCYSLECAPGFCLKPWVRQKRLNSLEIQYLMLGHSAHVLRGWKKRPSFLFDRLVLNLHTQKIKRLKQKEIELITFIPQNTERSWILQGSPAYKIAHTLSEVLKIPVFEAFKTDEHTHTENKRQALKNLTERKMSMINFKVQKNMDRQILGKKILIVDDFYTTGRTLQSAAQALMQRGASAAHGFCLGLRPPRQTNQNHR